MLFVSKKKKELYHHGIEGQRWGERRYQNYDGSLTDLGRRRYGIKGVRNEIKTLKRETVQAGYNVREASKSRNMDMAKKFADDYHKKEEELRTLVQDAKKQFGDTKIKDLKYKTYTMSDGSTENMVTGSTLTAKDFAVSAGKTMAMNMGFAALGIPLVYLSVPSSSKKSEKEYRKAVDNYYRYNS